MIVTPFVQKEMSSTAYEVYLVDVCLQQGNETALIRTAGRKVLGSSPIRVRWDVSAPTGSYPELGVLWAQWEGRNHTVELHPLHGCVFESVALTT